MDLAGGIVVAPRYNLPNSIRPHVSLLAAGEVERKKGGKKKGKSEPTSVISSLGNDKNGISAALHAIKYPYSTLNTLSCAMINRSLLSLSSSKIIGSNFTARS